MLAQCRDFDLLRQTLGDVEVPGRFHLLLFGEDERLSTATAIYHKLFRDAANLVDMGERLKALTNAFHDNPCVPDELLRDTHLPQFHIICNDEIYDDGQLQETLVALRNPGHAYFHAFSKAPSKSD